MLKILGYFTSIVLIIVGITLLLDEDSLTRESLKEHEKETIIIHKKMNPIRRTEVIDPQYKKKYNLEYYWKYNTIGEKHE